MEEKFVEIAGQLLIRALRGHLRSSCPVGAGPGTCLSSSSILTFLDCDVWIGQTPSA